MRSGSQQRYTESEKKYIEENIKLTDEYKRFTEQFKDLQAKFHYFGVTDMHKLMEVYRCCVHLSFLSPNPWVQLESVLNDGVTSEQVRTMREEQLLEISKKVEAADRIIHEQILNWCWQRTQALQDTNTPGRFTTLHHSRWMQLVMRAYAAICYMLKGRSTAQLQQVLVTRTIPHQLQKSRKHLHSQ